MNLRGAVYSLLGIFGSAVLVFGSAYAFKPGDCPPINSYNTSGHFDVAFVYGSGPETILGRAGNAADLNGRGIADYLVPLGGEREIEDIINFLQSQGVKKESIIRPDAVSRSTSENIRAGYQTVASRNLGGRIAHVSSKNHLPRIRMLNEELGLMNSHDDGYFGDFETRYGTPILKLFPRLDAMIYDSDVREWLACVANGR